MADDANSDADPALDFQELMRQATQIKEAQLADKRKEWTAAPLFIKRTYSPAQDIVRVRQNGSEQEKLAVMQEQKEQGNEKFREKDYDAALSFYGDAIAVVHYFEQIGEDMPFRQTEDTFRMNREIVKDLLCQLYSNMAACLFQQQKLDDLCFVADKAISLRPKTAAKAYYRRGYGKLLYGTIDDIDDVKHDLKMALSISPEDSQIKRALRDLAKETAKYKTVSKKAYAKAFQSEATPMPAKKRPLSDRITNLVGSARTKHRVNRNKNQKTKSGSKDRLHVGLLYILAIISTAILVRLCVRIISLATATISRNDEL